MNPRFIRPPERHGLYRREYERDSCGVGFVCSIRNQPSHRTLQAGVEILLNLVHRGAVGANPTTGDGAGILMQIPDRLLRSCRRLGFDLPPPGDYAVGMLFLPQGDSLRDRACEMFAASLAEEGLELLGWRDVPCSSAHLNDEVKASEPVVRQAFIGRPPGLAPETFDVRLYVAKRLFEHRVRDRTDRAQFEADPAGVYLVSLSARTVVYKGMFLADQLDPYYPDLVDSGCESALAIVHQRFSTNTFPAWSLAHPYRMIAHNGEINTVRGNINNMLARQHSISCERFGDELAKTFPLLDEGLSDTGTFDNALELLVAGGYSIAQAMAMMIPEAWQGNGLMDARRRAFYMHHAAMMEPWDGPALVAFTDGRQLGAMLDRNGLRPARYIVTADDRVVMASESGVLDVAESDIVRKWRLEPGRTLLIDLEQRRIVEDDEFKRDLAEARPYRNWVAASQIELASLPDVAGNGRDGIPVAELARLQKAFGYTAEDLKFVLEPMVIDGAEPVGSMGDDSPLAVLSSRPRPLASYFRQEFAQVTNPAIDPIREEMVMATGTYLGARPNLLSVNSSPVGRLLALETPVLSESEFARVRGISELTDGEIVAHTIDITYPAADGPAALEPALDAICDLAADQAGFGAAVLILSDRAAGPDRIAIPALLALSAVHHRLIDSGDRTRVGLVVDTASAREVHDFAVLAGYGAEAVCPYLAYATIRSMPMRVDKPPAAGERMENYRRAVRKGLLKVMSKMGVSTYQSFCGAQLFEAVGLGERLIDKYFCRSISQIGGIGIGDVARESHAWHGQAYGESADETLDCGGEYAYRVGGEGHLWTPDSVSRLQQAVRTDSYATYEQYAQLINEQSEQLMTLRGMMSIRAASEQLPLEEIEPASEIVRRFSTGAMSFGSISWEAHTTLAIAMNRIGGKSNTGEGGEDPRRFLPLANGDSMRSAIKQVASGRFGVTAEYLANSDMMQIKIAQGAKPGEGGQLPGHKVDAGIAAVRHSVPGVGLISPPPHHDIYSIEDIAQLIHDLKNVNPDGDVSVKLVSRYGVGTVAAGVAKAKSDHITIAGHDGGTGASPLSSIKHAGTPWELGLAETNQTLVLNDLRSRVVLQVDGQIKTGRDVVIGALLGADEFGFSTAPLVAQGCVMMRKCHLNTCPVGIATQDPQLRRKFAGEPEHVVNYFFFVAEEVRREMARMGIRRFDDMIGRVDLLARRPTSHPKARQLDLGMILKYPEAPREVGRFHSQRQDHGLELSLDSKLMPQLDAAIAGRERAELDIGISNANRTFAAMISGAIAKRHGHAGLDDGSITIRATGSAGQSFGAFLARGVTLKLVGDTNDYCGKGLSGGTIAVMPPDVGRAGADIIVGNTCLYGAIDGSCYFRGVAGERFAVRNSGAAAVIEGAGDHCCEYMTGGTVVVLGAVGRNFAAGMSGGVAYVLDSDGSLESLCNRSMVDLEPLSDQIAADSHLGRSDTDILRELLRAHHEHTRSPLASAMLKDWNTWTGRFVKVMPREYRRALQAMAAEPEAQSVSAA